MAVLRCCMKDCLAEHDLATITEEPVISTRPGQRKWFVLENAAVYYERYAFCPECSGGIFSREDDEDES